MNDARAIALWDAASAAPSGWTAIAAAGSQARVNVEATSTGSALRFDFELASATAFAIVRLELAAELPPHYALRFALRGAAPANAFQVKLIDPSASVWWWRLPHFEIPKAPSQLVLRRAGLAFAWGPAGGGEPRALRAVEIAVQAGQTGPGTLWIDALSIEPRGTTGTLAPEIRASSYVTNHAAAQALSADPDTCWRPAPEDSSPWLELDLGATCELGGLAVDWAGDAPVSRLQGSLDGTHWQQIAESHAGGSRSWLRAEADARYLRITPEPSRGVAIRHVGVVPLELAVAPVRYLESLARAAPRGHYPRHLLGEATAWAVVGSDASARKGLLSEDGALEVAREAWSIEPFLLTEDRLLSWADVQCEVALAEGHLPLPSVCWRAPGLTLQIDAFHSGPAQAGALLARYQIENQSSAARVVKLCLALRPFQVTPAWQGLIQTGGFAPLTQLERRGERVQTGTAELVCVTRADGFGARIGDAASLASQLAMGRMPSDERVSDPLGLAEAVLVYEIELAAGAREQIVVALPDEGSQLALPEGLARRDAASWAEALRDSAVRDWQARLAAIPIELPAAPDLSDTLRACIAWLLVDREGSRLQPGTRAYRRSWIRDGTGMAGALLEMGFAEPARAFLRWYAPYQRADGSVPCAVDAHGEVDPVVEHDSHGELIWGIIEIFRHTRDRAFLAELWPHVMRAVDHLEALRAQRTTDAHRGRASFGLLPESISHEGYSAQPVHAYWDDFYAVRGLGDAADAAEAQGLDLEARRYRALHEAMRDDVAASIRRSIADHRIDFVPGSVELGDLDPTGTAVVFDPCGLEALLPPDALRRTFELWWEEQATDKESTTPYELRNAVAFLRLEQPERAIELLTRWLGRQLPSAWRQWPEICWRDPRVPRFFGDLPHGWSAATFVRALRRMLVDERPDGSLVLAAGVPEAWLSGDGIRVRGLSTHYGPLHMSLRARGDQLQASFGAAIETPPGGIRLLSPPARPLRSVLCDGAPHHEFAGREVRLRELPRELTLVR